MDDDVATFLGRLDEFAAALSPKEQLMLQQLISDDDDAVGFGAGGWPGTRSVVPQLKIGTLGVAGSPISNGDLGSGRFTDDIAGSKSISGTDLGSGR